MEALKVGGAQTKAKQVLARRVARIRRLPELGHANAEGGLLSHLDILVREGRLEQRIAAHLAPAEQLPRLRLLRLSHVPIEARPGVARHRSALLDGREQYGEHLSMRRAQPAVLLQHRPNRKP